MIRRTPSNTSAAGAAYDTRIHSGVRNADAGHHRHVVLLEQSFGERWSRLRIVGRRLTGANEQIERAVGLDDFDARRRAAAERRVATPRSSRTIASIATAHALASASAASAACCEIVAAFDVVCDWSAAMLRARPRGAIDHPMRQPVIANDFATPSTTTSRSMSARPRATTSPRRSYADLSIDLVADDPPARFVGDTRRSRRARRASTRRPWDCTAS